MGYGLDLTYHEPRLTNTKYPKVFVLAAAKVVGPNGKEPRFFNVKLYNTNKRVIDAKMFDTKRLTDGEYSVSLSEQQPRVVFAVEAGEVKFARKEKHDNKINQSGSTIATENVLSDGELRSSSTQSDKNQPIA